MRSYFPLLGVAVLCALFSGCEVQERKSAEVTAAPPIKAKAPHSVQGDLQFVHGFQDGYETAVASGKPMLVFFTAEWCDFCFQMGREAFTNPATVRLSDQFVCILVDRDQELDICKQYGVNSFPTIQFLSPKGALLNRLEGKNSGQQVIVAMQQALQSVARRAEQPGGDNILR